MQPTDFTGLVEVSAPQFCVTIAVRAGRVIDAPPPIAKAKGVLFPEFIERAKARGWKGRPAGDLPRDLEVERIAAAVEVRRQTAGMERGKAAVVKQSLFARRAAQLASERYAATVERFPQVAAFLAALKEHLQLEKFRSADVVDLDFRGLAVSSGVIFADDQARSLARFEACKLIREFAARFPDLDVFVAPWDLPERGFETFTMRLREALEVA